MIPFWIDNRTTRALRTRVVKQRKAELTLHVRLEQASIPPKRALGPRHGRRRKRSKLIHERSEHCLVSRSLIDHALPKKLALASTVDTSSYRFERAMTHQVLEPLQGIINDR